MSLPSGPTSRAIGFALCRVVVPLWVFAGATFKLVERTPKLLPQNIWESAVSAGINLYWLLFVLVALEFLAVGVMVFLPRLARYMAIWMLGCFCAILLWEIASGHTKCGCLGAFSPSPWVMLAIDGTLLLGVLFFRPGKREGGWVLRGEALRAGAWILAGFLVPGVLILRENRSDRTEVVVSTPPTSTTPAAGTVTDGGGGTTAPAPAVTARTLPPYFTLDAQAMLDEPFLETPLAGLVSDCPPEVTQGLHHVIVFSRSCDHCQDLLETHFMDAPPIPTTLVAIPEKKKGFTEDTWLDMGYCKECVSQLELPTGVDWVITPPVVIAVEEGVVKCVKEADDSFAPECLLWR